MGRGREGGQGRGGGWVDWCSIYTTYSDSWESGVASPSQICSHACLHLCYCITSSSCEMAPIATLAQTFIITLAIALKQTIITLTHWVLHWHKPSSLYWYTEHFIQTNLHHYTDTLSIAFTITLTQSPLHRHIYQYIGIITMTQTLFIPMLTHSSVNSTNTRHYTDTTIHHDSDTKIYCYNDTFSIPLTNTFIILLTQTFIILPTQTFISTLTQTFIITLTKSSLRWLWFFMPVKKWMGKRDIKDKCLWDAVGF